jgi:hypothetical protein
MGATAAENKALVPEYMDAFRTFDPDVNIRQGREVDFRVSTEMFDLSALPPR